MSCDLIFFLVRPHGKKLNLQTKKRKSFATVYEATECSANLSFFIFSSIFIRFFFNSRIKSQLIFNPKKFTKLFF